MKKIDVAVAIVMVFGRGIRNQGSVYDSRGIFLERKPLWQMERFE